jgi:hypothetical protein
MVSLSDTENIIAALGQSNRVCKVNLYVGGWLLEKVLAPMQVPFPELTDLRLKSYYNETPVIPDSFLGGSAPRMRHLSLHDIPFPGLPNLSLTATHLVSLRLYDSYISTSPKEMVDILSALSSLRIFSLEFEYRPAGGWESQSLPKRSILPALTRLYFRGDTEYLEDLVTRIDTPQLDKMHITLIDQIVFDCPQLAQFINRSPTLRAHDEAHVQFDHHFTSAILLAQSRTLMIEILGRERDRQYPFIRQICNSSLDPLSTVEVLYIVDEYIQPVRKIDGIENTLWLQLLRPFTAVKNLYLSERYAPGIAAALQELVEGTETGVLPGLQNIFVEEPSGPFQETIGQFVAARQLSDRPVAISFWDRDSYVKPK